MTILAIYPHTRGIAYAVFEGIYTAVDWGIKTAKQETKHATSLAHVRQLLDWFHPQIILMQNCDCAFLRCSKTVAAIIESITEAALCENIAVRLYTRVNIRECFCMHYGATTKHEIARAIGEVLPDFAPYVPSMRRLWESEKHQMAVFDAVSLIFTYYYFDGEDLAP